MQMLKIFQKRLTTQKIFFGRQVKYRSVAYGAEIQDEFQKWVSFYHKTRENLRYGFWLFAQGDFTNNRMLIDKLNRTVYRPSDFAVVESKSILPPLFYNDLMLEADEQGYLLINGKRDISLGNCRSWCLSVTPGNPTPEVRLIVLAQLPNALQFGFSVFEVNGETVTPAIYSVPQLEETLDPETYLVCFGKHLFAVHNNILHYYYLDLSAKALETVAIEQDCPAEETECCKNVFPQVVADEKGNIFWFNDHTVYSIRVGNPKDVVCVDQYQFGEISYIQTFKGLLLVGHKRNSMDIEQFGYGESSNGWTRTEIEFRCSHPILLERMGKSYRYLAVSEKRCDFMEGPRVLEQTECLKCGTKGIDVWVNKTLVKGIRAIGYSSSQKKIILVPSN